MELDERKKKILKAIIQTYMETGEPVGSRTISKYADLNLSSATIRNEMSDLEEMGYIIQPHTSAGRIPSDQGYRLYVDELMKEKEGEVASIRETFLERTDKLERVLRQVVKVLANTTNYATMITGPQLQNNKLKFLQLSKVNENQVLVIVMIDGNLFRNKMIDLNENISDEELIRLNFLMNSQLAGMPIGQINLAMIHKLKEQAGTHSVMVDRVIDIVAELIAQEEEDVPVYTSGATNFFKYPELSDSQRASQLISTFEEKQDLAMMLQDLASDDDAIQVHIGNENALEPLTDCSLVTATYDIGDGMKGTIGIVGPKRMNYSKVVDDLKMLKAQMDQVFSKPQPDDE